MSGEQWAVSNQGARRLAHRSLLTTRRSLLTAKFTKVSLFGNLSQNFCAHH